MSNEMSASIISRSQDDKNCQGVQRSYGRDRGQGARPTGQTREATYASEVTKTSKVSKSVVASEAS
jgi:hypothetical protein